MADWEEAYSNIKAVLGITAESPTPNIPRVATAIDVLATTSTLGTGSTKRKADGGGDVTMADSAETNTISKKSKSELKPAPKETITAPTPAHPDDPDPQLVHARAAVAFIPFLSPENLLPPKLPTREEMEAVLLDLRKRALVEEYFGNSEEQKA